MADASKIEWTDATFNHVRGCTKISAGCAHCYADTLSKRNPLTLGVWGPNGTRVVAAESAWREPVRWNRLAAEGRLPDGSPNVDGHRPRVFCASLADVFEDWQGEMIRGDKRLSVYTPNGGWLETWRDTKPPGPDEHCVPLRMADVRARLFKLIDATPNLDWLLVTKRPENVARMMPAYFPGGYIAEAGTMNQEGPRPNVWLGVSVESQAAADERIPHLLRTPAAVRFLSCEPLLGPVDLRNPFYGLFPERAASLDTYDMPGGEPDDLAREPGPRIGWVIVGGESGPGARPCRVEWLRSIVAQCKATLVPVFVKQLGSNPEGDTFPEDDRDPATENRTLHVRQVLTVRDKKGGDIAEFPDDLKAREFPAAGRTPE